MVGEDFMYGSSWLSDFDMMMVSSEDAQQFVSRNFDRGDITSLRAKPNHYSAIYNDSLTLSFFIMKTDGCDEQDKYKITGDEVHYLRSWLESPKKPTELVVTNDENEINVHYYGIFSSVQPFVHEDSCYGLYLTFTCDSPYGYSDEFKMRYNISSSVVAVSGKFVNMSAEHEEYLMPVVTISSSSTFGSNETLSIKNVSDNNKEMVLTLPQGSSKLVIDCEKKIVTDGNGNLVTMSSLGVTVPQNSTYNFISTDMFVFYWLSLVHGENRLTFTPSSTNTISTVEISTKYIVKSGGF